MFRIIMRHVTLLIVLCGLAIITFYQSFVFCLFFVQKMGVGFYSPTPNIKLKFDTISLHVDN